MSGDKIFHIFLKNALFSTLAAPTTFNTDDYKPIPILPDWYIYGDLETPWVSILHCKKGNISPFLWKKGQGEAATPDSVKKKYVPQFCLN